MSSTDSELPSKVEAKPSANPVGARGPDAIAPSNVSRAQLEQLREYDTALLANLLDRVDKTPTHLWYMGNNIRSLIPTLSPTVGIAVTCEIDTSSPNDQAEGDAEAMWQQLEQMEALRLPTVWVVKCVGSRPDHECVLGDGMAKLFYSVGCMGVVTNGGIRDLPGLYTVPFAAYAAGTTIHHCRMRIRRPGISVEVGGIRVSSGDIIHAGAEGVIKLAPASIPALLDRAPAYRAFEHEAHQLFRRVDLTISEKRKQMPGLMAKYGF